jgi:hypothetical protein
VGIFELNAELEVLLDNTLDGDRRRDCDTARLAKFGQQCCGIVLDLFLGKVGHFLRHLSVILICIVERTA